jgi:hypothetical protein
MRLKKVKGYRCFLKILPELTFPFLGYFSSSLAFLFVVRKDMSKVAYNYI